MSNGVSKILAFNGTHRSENGFTEIVLRNFLKGVASVDGQVEVIYANTVVTAPHLPATERKATYVFNKAPDGVWLCSIDNSYGHEIIGKSA